MQLFGEAGGASVVALVVERLELRFAFGGLGAEFFAFGFGGIGFGFGLFQIDRQLVELLALVEQLFGLVSLEAEGFGFGGVGAVFLLGAQGGGVSMMAADSWAQPNESAAVLVGCLLGLAIYLWPGICPD